MYYSFVGMSSLAFFIHYNIGIVFQSEEMLTTLLLGGLINGVGLGLILKVNSSTGGNDILSKILNRYFSYSIATLNFLFNVIIIGLSIFFFGLDKAIETLVTMYISAITIKFILEGLNYKRTVFIITDKYEAVSKSINDRLKRGCTIIDGKGAYTGSARHVLYAIISISQEAKLRSIVRDTDENALINVIETRVVFGSGRGFLNINPEKESL
jgi:uncharacterized membrane-anchored protein YitT (DUF2179 family)